MNTTTRTANADQLHATVRDARDCDALTPCANCRAMTAEVRAARHAAHVAALRAERLPALAIPTPRTSLAARLAAALR